MSVTVSVRDARASDSDRRWIQSVYRDYLDDLAPDTGVFPVLGEVGHREPDQILRWFGDPNAFPLVILKSEEPVGFAMVARAAPSAAKPRVDYRMAEFFITEYLRNAAAVSFWRHVVATYTRGSYQERIVNGEVRQVFESGRKRSV
jgi:predicted acetyltransferase